MKRLFVVFLFLLHQQLFSAPGCMDNSSHVTEWYDHKNYRLVKNVIDGHAYPCSCPCESYGILEDRGRCPVCLHYRDVRPTIVIQNQAYQMTKPKRVKKCSLEQKKLTWLRKLSHYNKRSLQ